MRSRWLVLALALSACGVDAAGSATTIVPIGPTDFATIPPAVTTIEVAVTTLPPGAVGVEQIYVVQAGDSPIKVSTAFGISVEQLLSWNGLISTSQFPYPGRQLKIPPSAQVTVNQTQQTVVANPVGKPGCGNRPAGTYEVQAGGFGLGDSQQVLCVGEFAIDRQPVAERGCVFVPRQKNQHPRRRQLNPFARPPARV